MTRHKKHEDSLDVQIRTKILDEYGNPMEGVIEYDPKTGYGKRIKDAKTGLIEEFYRGGGHIEIDGHTFTDENHDIHRINAVKTLIDAKVARGTPEYEQLLKHHIDASRTDEINTKKANKPTTTEETVNIHQQKFIANTQIAKGEQVIINTYTNTVTGIRADNIHRPNPSKKNPRIEPLDV